MSTHSHIGIRSGNEVKYIYCHSDGYLSYVGNFLSLFYRDEAKVAKLISLGDISCIGYNVDAPRPFTSFETKKNLDGTVELGASYAANYSNRHVKTSFVLSYGRDRKEKGVEARICKYVDYPYINDFSYCYLYYPDRNKWYLVLGMYGEVFESDIDKLAKSKSCYENFIKNTPYNIETYESFIEAREDFLLDMSKRPERQINAVYNDFLKRKNITDIEFDYVRGKDGHRMFGLLKKGTYEGEKRKVLIRSDCIGDCVYYVLEHYPVSYWG